MKKLIFAFGILAGTMLFAQSPGFGIDETGGLPEGLAEGTSAPDFTGVDQNGNKITLKDQLQKGEVVLIFYRGYWCPVCNKYLSKFQKDIGLILNKGASVIAITPELNDGVEKTVNKNNIGFSVLSDKYYSIMDQYGVRFLVTDKYARKINTFLKADIASNNGDEQPFLPVPATYIIGKNQKIIKTFFDPNYKERPSVQEIIKHLE